jgi:hypothetical protein
VSVSLPIQSGEIKIPFFSRSPLKAAKVENLSRIGAGSYIFDV